MLKKMCVIAFVSLAAKLTNATIELIFNSAIGKHAAYEGFGLYDIEVHSPEQISALIALKKKFHLDIWLFPTTARHGKVLVPSNLKKTFQKTLGNVGIKYNLEVKNVREHMDQEDVLLSAASWKSNQTRSSDLSFNQIHDFKVNSSKPVIFILSLLHAREWITLPVSLYAIKKLVHEVSDQALQHNIDWIILPVANPDGYIFSHNKNRLWRKNLRSSTSNCMGVDLNRNFDVNWGTESGNDFCDADFHGQGPFSEPETVAIRNIFSKYSNRIKLFLDIHSAGSMIIYAYGNGTVPTNGLQLHVLGVRQADAIDAVKWSAHPNYTFGGAVWTIGHKVSGVTFDYAQKIVIPYAYVYELPVGHSDLNRHLVNPDFIEQAGFETWEGIKAAAFAVLDDPFLLSKGSS